jgi:hypothetical protein
MPVYRVRIRKQHDVRLIEWENRYYVQADTISDADSIAGVALVDCETAIHNAGVTIIRRVVSDLPTGGAFITTPLSVACTGGQAGDELPPFLTANVTADVEGFGLPDRKYYHTFWGESAQAGGQWSPTALDTISDAYQTLFDTLSGSGAAVVDVEGNAWVSVTALSPVGSHKFSKRSKRAVAGP